MSARRPSQDVILYALERAATSVSAFVRGYFRSFLPPSPRQTPSAASGAVVERGDWLIGHDAASAGRALRAYLARGGAASAEAVEVAGWCAEAGAKLLLAAAPRDHDQLVVLYAPGVATDVARAALRDRGYVRVVGSGAVEEWDFYAA